MLKCLKLRSRFAPLIHIKLAAPKVHSLTLGILGTLAHFRHLFLCNRTSLKKCQLLLKDAKNENNIYGHAGFCRTRIKSSSQKQL